MAVRNGAPPVDGLLTRGARVGFELVGDSHLHAPIPVGATVRIAAKAIDNYVKRERRYVRYEVTVTDVNTGTLYLTETRDILSL